MHVRIIRYTINIFICKSFFFNNFPASFANVQTNSSQTKIAYIFPQTRKNLRNNLMNSIIVIAWEKIIIKFKLTQKPDVTFNDNC